MIQKIKNFSKNFFLHFLKFTSFLKAEHNLFLPIGLALASLFVIFSSYSRLEDFPVKRGELIVATDLDVPGYFSLNDEMFGYQHDLLNAYAKYIGIDLKIVTGNTPTAYQAMLSDNKLDIVSTIKNHITDTTNIAIPVYNTSYVVLTGRKNAKTINNVENIHTVLNDKKILISHGFSASKSYDLLLDAISGSQTFLSSRNCFELIDALSNGDVDFVICERSEAQLGCALVRNIKEVYEFKEEIPVYVIFNKKNSELARNFSTWLQTYSLSDEYAELNSMYFDKGMATRILSRGLEDREKGAISVFDETFKKVCKAEGVDWRMAAAIAYNESQFNPYIVSHQGAKGLMQIMPSVARQFKVDNDSIMKPEHNIRLALKLIKKIESSLRIAPGTDFENRMSIVLACYNGGIGHVLDARKLAIKYGGNPDSWADVSHYLKQKAKPEYSNDEVVKSGKFNGSSETLAFVSKVINKYHSYCNRVAR